MELISEKEAEVLVAEAEKEAEKYEGLQAQAGSIVDYDNITTEEGKRYVTLNSRLGKPHRYNIFNEFMSSDNEYITLIPEDTNLMVAYKKDKTGNKVVLSNDLSDEEKRSIHIDLIKSL